MGKVRPGECIGVYGSLRVGPSLIRIDRTGLEFGPERFLVLSVYNSHAYMKRTVSTDRLLNTQT